MSIKVFRNLTGIYMKTKEGSMDLSDCSESDLRSYLERQSIGFKDDLIVRLIHRLRLMGDQFDIVGKPDFSQNK